MQYNDDFVILVNGLVAQLGADDYLLREAAKRQLIGLGEPVIPLLAEALGPPHRLIRQEIIAVLGALKHPSVVHPLLQFSRGATWRDQFAAMRVFREMGDIAVDVLSIILLGDNDPAVRADAAFVLGELSPPAGFEPLTRALRDVFSFVRLAAITALKKYTYLKEVEPLLIALRDSNLAVQIEGALMLARHGDVRAGAILMRALEENQVAEERRAEVLEALAHIDDPRVFEVLVDAIHGGLLENGVVVMMIRALAQMNDSRLLPILLGLAEDHENAMTVRLAARAILRDVGYMADDLQNHHRDDENEAPLAGKP